MNAVTFPYILLQVHQCRSIPEEMPCPRIQLKQTSSLNLPILAFWRWTYYKLESYKYLNVFWRNSIIKSLEPQAKLFQSDRQCRHCTITLGNRILKTKHYNTGPLSIIRQSRILHCTGTRRQSKKEKPCYCWYGTYISISSNPSQDPDSFSVSTDILKTMQLTAKTVH